MRPKNRPLGLGPWPVAIRDPNTSCFGGVAGTKTRFERMRGKEVGTAKKKEGLSFQGEQTSGRGAGGRVDSRRSLHLVGETRRVDGDSALAGES